MIKKRFNIKDFVLYMVLIFIAFLCIVPLFWMVRSSFMKNTAIYVLDPFVVWPKEMLWENYKNAWTFSDFPVYTRNTLIIAIASLVGTIFTSSLAAYSFSRLKWKGRSFWFSVILSTLMLPATVTLIPQFLIWKNLHLVNTFYPLILPSFLGGGAYNIFLMRQFFLSIPYELDEAAEIDGTSKLQIYSMIVMPLSKSAIIVVGLFSFLYNWNDFFGPIIYLNDKAHFTLALGLLQFRGDYDSKWNLLMAASTIVIAPCILIYSIGQKYLIEGISLTGIKG